MTSPAMKRLLAVLFSFALIAAACGGDDDDASNEANATDSADDGGTTGGDSDDSGTDGGDSDSGSTDDGAIIETIEDEPNDGPVQGGTLRYGLEADVDGLNPTASSLSSPGIMMGHAVFDTLARWDTEGNAVPYLAESFTPSDDLMSWTVKLREGIKFHDGTDLTIDAVLLTFETQRADPLVGLAVKPFYPEEDAVIRVDDYTATFNLLDANAYFPAALTGQLGMIASPTWIAAALEDPTLDQQPVGTGPFIFDSRSEDSVTRFIRNDDWWAGDVYLDAIEFVPVTDSNTRTDLLINGELNAIQTTNQEDIEILREEGGIQAVERDDGEESFVMINSGSAPFDDIRAREALTLATPRQDYLDLITLNISRPATQFNTPESPFYNPDVMQEMDNPDAAVALAGEYCADFPDNCTDGKIDMKYQWAGPSVVGTRQAELLDEGWSAAFNVEFVEVAQDALISNAAFGQYNTTAWRQFGAIQPQNDNVWLLCRTAGGISLNWPQFCDEERDALLLEAQASTDETRRIEIYQELAQKLNDDFLYIIFNHTLWVNAFGDNVKGVCSHVSPEGIELRCSSGGLTWADKIWIEE